jgi:anaerobic magnesium-protoporphyrin IX monomethyl ester cyclase
MNISLCSVPVEGAGTKLDRLRSEGPTGVVPKVAILSLINWMEKNGYRPEDYDFYDIDMLYPSDEEIRNYFENVNPTIVGLSAVVSTSYQQIKRITKIIRIVCPNAWIVLGGNLAAAAEVILHRTEVDLCVVGDGEIAWLNFLNYVKDHKREWNYEKLSNIAGLSYLNSKNAVMFNGYEKSIPPNEIPFPDYEILKRGLKNHPEMIQNYFRPALDSGWFNFDSRASNKNRPPNMGGVFVTKGCVAKCTFCQRSTKRYQQYDLSGLEKHLIYLIKEYSVGFIQILDENFGSNKNHAYEVARLMKKHNLLWIATGIRCKSVNEDDIKFYKENNCSALKFGVESGSQKILDIMEKRFSIEDVYQAIKNCIQNSMFSPLAVMVGMPGETIQTAMETGAFIGEIASLQGVHPNFLGYDLFYALPLPGTPLFEYGIQLGIINDSIKGLEEYLENVTDAGTFKRYYVNLNGAPMSEVLSWDWILRLEASRVFHKNRDKLFLGNDLKNVYLGNIDRNAKSNPRLKLKYSSITFTWLTEILDNKIIGNPLMDRIPRVILYPIIKYAVFVEFVIQSMFSRNKKHNIFKKIGTSKNNIRIKAEFFTRTTKRSDKSLRKIVEKKYQVAESPDHEEKSRKLLLRGL